jgi:hypothetical protein
MIERIETASIFRTVRVIFTPYVCQCRSDFDRGLCHFEIRQPLSERSKSIDTSCQYGYGWKSSWDEWSAGVANNALVAGPASHSLGG